MRLSFTALAACAFAGLAPMVAQAESTTNFRGLFEGVDPADGSVIRLQITCEEDGLCTVLGADSFFSLCSDSEGRGLLEGEGRVADGVLVVPVFTLTCANGDEVEVTTSFTPDEHNEALIDRPENLDLTPITYHRINVPLRLR